MLQSTAGTAEDAQALDTEARQALDAGEFTRARQLFEKVLVIWRLLQNTDEIIYGLLHVSQMMLFEPGYDPAIARPLLEEAWQLAQGEGMEACLLPVQNNLAILAIEEKEYGKALRLGQQLLLEGLQEDKVEWRTGRIMLIGFAIIGLGEPEKGLLLYIAAISLRQRSGIPDLPPYIQEHHRRVLEPIRRQLSPERIAMLEAEAQAMSLDEAVATALAFTPFHLELRDVRDDDLPIFFEHQRDPVAIHMAAFAEKEPAEMDGFLAHWKRIRADESIPIKTILVDGVVVGYVLSFEEFGKRDVSYWIGREYWGKGIATKALAEFLKHFKTRPLYGRAAKDNIASIRVLQKCGFTICGENKDFANARGEEIEEFILILSARG